MADPVKKIPAADPPDFGPIQDMRDARQSWAAALLGAAAGGFVPIESYAVMHRGGTLELKHQVLVAACLTYSSLSVWHWAKNALGSPWKAAVWVVLLEGGMLFGGIPWLEWAALVFLVFINATHSSSLLARRDERDVALVKAIRGKENESSTLLEESDGDSVARSRDEQVGPRLLSLPLAAEGGEMEVLYQRAVQLVISSGSCTVSALKRELKVGHSRAVWLAERLERDRIVGPQEVGGRRLLVAEARPTADNA